MLWNEKYYICQLRIHNKSMWAEVTGGLKRVYNVIAQYSSAGTDSGMKLDEEDIKDNKIIVVHVFRKIRIRDRSKGHSEQMFCFSLCIILQLWLSCRDVNDTK